MAFLVGGCVRDLLLGLEPEGLRRRDRCAARGGQASCFATAAWSGRRFRLAHVFFGRETIEVATFRATSAPSQGDEPLPRRTPRTGRRRSSTSRSRRTSGAHPPTGGFGERRTIHRPLFDAPDASCATTSTAPSTRMSGGATSPPTRSTTTSPTSRSGTTSNGAEDIAARTLRLIGDPETRFREDPVRMLRAARFEAKLGFTHRSGDRARRIGRCASCSAGCRRRGCSMRP